MSITKFSLFKRYICGNKLLTAYSLVDVEEFKRAKLQKNGTKQKLTLPRKQCVRKHFWDMHSLEACTVGFKPIPLKKEGGGMLATPARKNAYFAV